MLLSYLILSEKDVSGYSESDIQIAECMYRYVKHNSRDFKCSYSRLLSIWEAAYFEFVFNQSI